MCTRTVVVICLVGLVTLTGPRQARAQDAMDYKKLYEEQKAKTGELEKRLAIIEEKLAAEPFVKTEDVTEPTLNFITGTELSGYAAASYLYNFNEPATHENTGRGFDVKHNEFMVNKFVLRLEHPVEYNAFDWQAGYKGTLIFGQDAGFTQAAGLDLGSNGDLFEAYVTVNVPVGNGLLVSLGKCGTVIGYESTFTEENYNWSGGNQWLFAEPFTHTGLMLKYALSAELEAVIMINNGWDVVTDAVHGFSYIGQLTYTPNDNNTFSLIGFGGPENAAANWRRGVEFWAEHRFTPTFKAATQLDYGQEDGGDANSKKAEWYGAGLWLIYEPTETWSVAMRGDWFKDADGFRTSGAPAFAPFTIANGQELWSATLTLNYKPLPELRIAPELRWDRSSVDTAFDGHQDQVTLGIGAVYSY